MTVTMDSTNIDVGSKGVGIHQSKLSRWESTEETVMVGRTFTFEEQIHLYSL